MSVECTLPASKITRKDLPLENRRPLLHSCIFLSKLIFPPAWDGLFLIVNVIPEELRLRRSTDQSDHVASVTQWRLQQRWKSLKSKLFPVSTLESTSPNIDCVFQARGEKSSRFKAKKVPQKSTESNASCRIIKQPWCPEPHSRAVIIQSVYYHEPHSYAYMCSLLTKVSLLWVSRLKADHWA